MANKNNKYKVYRKYTTDDNGISWVETDEYRIVLVEENSKDCITETPSNTRWVETTGYICANKNKYGKEIKQISTDGGKTWTNTSEYRQGKLIEENSKDCGYTEVQYRWVLVNDDSRYVCVGTEKHKMEIRQLSNDGGITWANVSPEETRASNEIIERNSLDCGGSVIYYKWVDTGFECGSNLSSDSKIVAEAPGELTKETVYRWVVAQGAKDYICDDGNVKYYLYVKQQSTDGGLTWSEVQPRETQKGAIMNNDSNDCRCKTNVTYNDGTTKEFEINGEFTEYSFKDIKSAKIVDIGTCVTGIGNYAFQHCSGLTSVTIGSGATYIGVGAFWDCSGLTSITIPNSVKSISSSFAYCSNLKSATIGSGVEYIGNLAFANCTSLKYITIPDSVRIIDGGSGSGYGGAFEGCSSLESATIGNRTSIIGQCAFLNCSGLTSITIPNSVAIIGESAFNGCSNLNSVTFGNGIFNIGDRAFQECSSLTSVTIESVKNSIGTYAFYKCSNLKSVTIGSGSIGSTAFEDCSSLSSVTIGSGVKSIGGGAFAGCSGLKSAIIASGSIGGSAFSYCTGLTSLEIGSGVTNIEKYAFAGCSGLTTVTIPGSVENIGNRAFSDCYSLLSITIESGVENIDDYSFSHCGKITSVNIPDGVTRIGDFVFNYCSNLTSITMPNSITDIGSRVFYRCVKFSSITFKGTKKQFSSIPKANDWFSSLKFVVHCTDGDIDVW